MFDLDDNLDDVGVIKTREWEVVTTELDRVIGQNGGEVERVAEWGKNGRVKRFKPREMVRCRVVL